MRGKCSCFNKQGTFFLIQLICLQISIKLSLSVQNLPFQIPFTFKTSSQLKLSSQSDHVTVSVS